MPTMKVQYENKQEKFANMQIINGTPLLTVGNGQLNIDTPI
jgi:hypothetical protein